MPAGSAPFANDFFPTGDPGLRRLSADETHRAWRALNDAAARVAADEKACCRSQAEEVIRLLAPKSEETKQ